MDGSCHVQHLHRFARKSREVGDKTNNLHFHSLIRHVRPCKLTAQFKVDTYSLCFEQKPIVALLAVPTQIFSTSASQSDYSIPTLKLPDSFTLPTDPNWYLKRVCGTSVGYVVGYVWTLLWYIGLGNAAIGAVNFLVGAAAWTWWTESRGIALGDGDV